MTTPHNQRTRLLASGLLAITFAAGALVGAAGDRLLATEQKPALDPVDSVARQEPKSERKERPPRGSMLLDPKVLEELGTTAEQRARIHAILERRDQDAKHIFEKIKPELDAMMKASREEIRAQLTAEQVKKLDQLIQERRARHSRERGATSKPQSDTSGEKQRERDHDSFMI